MNRPDNPIGPLRYRDGQPVFREQWHAQVIAVVELLVAEGKVTPAVWSETLGAELDKRSRNGDPDNDETYYSAFLSALESILDETGIVSQSEVDRREGDWRQAYLSTPHGEPVVLED